MADWWRRTLSWWAARRGIGGHIWPLLQILTTLLRPSTLRPHSDQDRRHREDEGDETFQHVILTHKYVVALFAFLISIDLIEIVGVLCYQLFTATYFPWHLYPMMLNRSIELIALLCSQGHISSAYSLTQIFLSLLSLTIYAKRQPCGEYSCAEPLILYTILLSYQIFVAIMVVKVSRIPMADDEGNIIANWPPPHIASIDNVDSDQDQQPPRTLGVQIMGLSARAIRARILNGQVMQTSRSDEDATIHACSPTTLRKALALDALQDIIIAVQQPDGKKLAIAKLCKESNISNSNEVDCCSSSSKYMCEHPKHACHNIQEKIIVEEDSDIRHTKKYLVSQGKALSLQHIDHCEDVETSIGESHGSTSSFLLSQGKSFSSTISSTSSSFSQESDDDFVDISDDEISNQNHSSL